MKTKWEELMELREEIDLSGKEMVQVGIRMPKEMKRLFVEDLRRIEDDEDLENMSLNEMILLGLIYAYNLKQNPKREVIRRSNNQNLHVLLKNGTISAENAASEKSSESSTTENESVIE